MRKQRNNSRLEFPCPAAVKGYNSYVGGVDQADILCSIYDVCCIYQGSAKKHRKVSYSVPDLIKLQYWIPLCNIQK